MKTLSTRIADEAHDDVTEIAALARLSMAATTEAMIHIAQGKHHIYAQLVKQAIKQHKAEQ